jgi:hypothetical protein
LQASGTKADEDRAQHKAELERVQSEATRTAALAKEEEEKRVKAISLLKTLRQKLVKTEKERDDALKEVGSAREKDQEEIQKERLEKARLLADIDKVNSERESALAGMKSHFDREFVALKERHQRELAAVKGQFESEAATAKVSSMPSSSACAKVSIVRLFETACRERQSNRGARALRAKLVAREVAALRAGPDAPGRV